MKSLNVKCIILGHKNFSEKDKLVFLYTQDLGKIKAIAKGSRSITSKFTGHLETLNFCTAKLYFGPKNIILTEITTDKIYFRKRTSLGTISNALDIAEITNQLLFENQKFKNLSKLIETTIKHLKSSRKKTLIKIAYIIKLLDKSGLIPDFKQTKISCEEKYIKFFNFIKSKSYSEIEKIKLTKSEKSYIKEVAKNLIHKETGKSFTFY